MKAAVLFGWLCAFAFLGLPAIAAPQPPELTRADLETWLDGYMPYALQSGDIAGAVVVAVKDGQVLLEKGFGFSDVAKHAPVEPEKTLFRPGSISKLFTWTAVMQLQEQGKLDLDADVNQYLDFKIPDRNGRPITLRNLMTHTPGFEEWYVNLMTVKAEMPLDAYLKSAIPARIFDPGEVPAYCNYGAALAGYIVQRVSGQLYEDYVEQHILQPLGMERTTFRQPVPESLRPFVSKGYRVGSGEPFPFEMFPAPAGALAATGDDVAKFMIAHLQNGTYGQAQILKPETAKMMHTTALTLAPDINRMVLGFYEMNQNGHRVIGHAGDTQVFHSEMYLFLDDNVGLFISLNSAGRGAATTSIRNGLIEGFADRYFPGAGDRPASGVDAATAAAHAQQMTGYYEPTLRGETTFLAFAGIFAQTEMLASPASIFSANIRDRDGSVIQWREVKPYVWENPRSGAKLAAKVVNGTVEMFSYDDFSPILWWQRVPAARSAAWLVPAIMIAAGILAISILLWPAVAVVRWKYSLSPAPASPAYRLTQIAGLCALAVFVYASMTVSKIFSDLRVTSEMTGTVWVIHILSLLVFGGGFVIALWNAASTWRAQSGLWDRLWSAVLLISFLIFLWVAIAYRLIAFNGNF